MERYFSSGGRKTLMEQTRLADLPIKPTSTNGGSKLTDVLNVIYESISDLNVQLPAERRIDKSPASVLFGEGGTLDSLGLSNFIVITEQKLQEFFGFSVDLTDDDPFSPTTGHFRTVHSLASYVCELAEKRSAGAL
jgi:acyl carrier protein